MDANGVAAPAAGAPVAAPAAGGNNVKEIQEALKKKGVYAGPINGEMDAATKEAIKKFKVANKLPADSVPGPRVMELLGIKA
jgi:peptidoglycan hydrolase-like protein with peptidoglycan-binding domain